MEDNSPDGSPSYLLYVRSTCMVCVGKSHGCPYCNGEGKEYIEASDRTIGRWLGHLDKERREDIFRNAMENLAGKENE